MKPTPHTPHASRRGPENMPERPGPAERERIHPRGWDFDSLIAQLFTRRPGNLTPAALALSLGLGVRVVRVFSLTRWLVFTLTVRPPTRFDNTF